MATPLTRMAPTCLSCLRRINPCESRLRAVAVAMVQVRAKSSKQPKDHGVVVRLLEDIPKFGRKGAIFRTERGRMRNLWYPHKRAEYMTVARFAELGISPNGIGERQSDFGLAASTIDADDEPTVEESKPTMRIQSVPPQRAAILLASLLPPTLTFYRKPIHSPGASREMPTPSAAGSPPRALFGSVSTEDIAAEIRQLLQGDAEGSLVRVGARDVRFVGFGDSLDRVKSLGRWDVEITVGGDAVAAGPVTKVIEVVAE